VNWEMHTINWKESRTLVAVIFGSSSCWSSREVGKKKLYKVACRIRQKSQPRGRKVGKEKQEVVPVPTKSWTFDCECRIRPLEGACSRIFFSAVRCVCRLVRVNYLPRPGETTATLPSSLGPPPPAFFGLVFDLLDQLSFE